jgi:multicomponent K+:H+ antiporter subunit A
MPESALLLPLIIILTGALIAALCGLPWLNRRLNVTQLSWLLALAPFSSFCILVSFLDNLEANLVFSWRLAWLPSIGFNLELYLDSLSALFGLLITLIGILVIIYAGQYFKGDRSAYRFLTYMLLFMGAMLGLVMAGDVLTLFIFWEGTSIVSFLLVAYKYKDEVARRSAFKALLITSAGGIALLVGLLFISYLAGSTTFTVILKSGDILRGSVFYPVMLILVAIGAFTKSAQFPFHIWLPEAMSAPTPASAYLHSATMVKAGIYLMARLNPALGQTEMWFWLLTLVGMATMLAGAYLGLKQNDIKALLAYSTISQLGILMAMIGQDIEIAFKALIIGILAHALYKSALFMVAGIVDHETGTRDLRRLGGLRRSMPYTFAVGALAALSMAGLPPLFGFLAKETLLATAFHPSLPKIVAWIFTLASIVTGALMFTLALMLLWDTFMGEPRDPAVRGHEPPKAMALAPAVPAILSLILGQLPGPKDEAALLANAAQAAHGFKVKVSLALWTGLNIPLVLSGVAVCLGVVLFLYRQRLRELQVRLSPAFTLNTIYNWALSGLDKAAFWATRMQQGKLRRYLFIILAAAIGLILIFRGLPPPLNLSSLSWPTADFRGELVILRFFALFLATAAALVSVWVRSDFTAILAFGASGLGVAGLMVLGAAPDVALVQIVVDMLSLVILVLALTRLPRIQRRRAQEVTFLQRPMGLARDGLIAVASGITVMLFTFSALLSRPRQSVVTPYYAANAKKMLGSKSIVGAIIVDYRVLDTLIEICVFGIAGLGIYTLLRYAARKFGDKGTQVEELPAPTTVELNTMGIGGTRASNFIRVLAYVILPVAMVIAVTDIIYGHDMPGDGFTAGVIISLAVGFWYVVFGYYETRNRLFWLKTSSFVAAGILLAIISGTLGVIIKGSFFANVDFGQMLGLSLPKGFHLSTSLLFELAICLSVVGSVTHMLNTFGHPGEEDRECIDCLRQIAELENKRSQ